MNLAKPGKPVARPYCKAVANSILLIVRFSSYLLILIVLVLGAVVVPSNFHNQLKEPSVVSSCVS